VIIDIYKERLVKISMYQSNVNPEKVLPVFDESIERTKIIIIGKYRIKIITPINTHFNMLVMEILFFLILN